MCEQSMEVSITTCSCMAITFTRLFSNGRARLKIKRKHFNQTLPIELTFTTQTLWLLYETSFHWLFFNIGQIKFYQPDAMIDKI